MTTRTPRVIPGFTAEQSASLFALGVVKDDDVARLSDVDASSEIHTSDLVARPGQFLRAQPLGPRGMALLLPSPDSTEPGARVVVSLERPGAPLRVSCVPNQGNGAQVTQGSINGQSRATFTVAGLLEFTSNGATHWTTPAEHPAESAAITTTVIAAALADAPDPTWAQVLAAGRVTGGLTPRVSAGDALDFESGATGITASGDLLVAGAGTIELESVGDMHLHTAGQLHVGHEDTTTTIHQGALGAIELVSGTDYSCQASGNVTLSAGGFFQVTTAAVLRLEIDATGAWDLAGDPGASGEVLTSQGAGAPPLWVAPVVPPTPGWDDVLAEDATSGANNPIVDVGQFMQFGLVGPTTGSPQIRSGDAVFRIRGSDSVSLVAEAGAMAIAATAGAASLASGTTASVSAGTALSLLTNATNRIVIASTGEWTTPAGSSGQFLKHQGAGSPAWATFALTDIPSQAADTFLGRLAGAGTPAAQALADLDSTSITYDAVSHTFQRAALTGAIAAGLNGNGTVFGGIRDNGSLETGRTNLNFLSSTSVIFAIAQDAGNDEMEITAQRAALTGDVTAPLNDNATTIANDAVTNAKAANMAQSTIKLRASGAGTGDPTDGTISQALDMASNTNGDMLVRSGGSWIAVPGAAAGEHLCRDSSGAPNWFDPTSNATSCLTLASTGGISVVPDNARHIIGDTGDGVGFQRSTRRAMWTEDFFSCNAGGTLTAGTVLRIECDTSWSALATTSNGSIAVVDGGTGGTDDSPGEVLITTGTSDNSYVDVFKGSAQTTRVVRMSDIDSVKYRMKIASTASCGFMVGFAQTSWALTPTDGAYFAFDTDSDTTIHCLSRSSSGAFVDTDTGVAPGTGYRTYEVRRGADVTDWEFYLDGALVATQNPGTKTRGTNIIFTVITRTTAAKTMTVDCVDFRSTDMAR